MGREARKTHVPTIVPILSPVQRLISKINFCWGEVKRERNFLIVSQIVINAKTENEALRVIKKLEKYVEKKYQTPEQPWLTTGKAANGTYKKIKVTPIRADYYPEGKENSSPKWRKYL